MENQLRGFGGLGADLILESKNPIKLTAQSGFTEWQKKFGQFAVKIGFPQILETGPATQDRSKLRINIADVDKRARLDVAAVKIEDEKGRPEGPVEGQDLKGGRCSPS
jgi:hypothetical protein